MEKIKCKICGQEFIDVEKYDVPTYEFNFPEGVFEYVVCQNCFSIQIKDIPDNLGDYYNNENYYSFSDFNKIVRFLLYHFHKNYFNFDLIGYLTSFFIQYDESWNSTANLFRKGRIDYDSKILDVGCGNGIFISHLSDLGFKNVEGIDPFIEKDIVTPNFKVYKKDIFSMTTEKSYDMIFFKDSLEHVFNPIQTLSKASELLSDNGIIFITIPIKNGLMWDFYKEYSFVLCPPTHIAVPSLKGLEIMSKKFNLEIMDIICDSNEFLLLMSEDKVNNKKQYASDSISVHFNSLNPIRKFYNLYVKKFDTHFFSESSLTIHQIQKRVMDLNRKKESDHAIVILKKSSKN